MSRRVIILAILLTALGAAETMAAPQEGPTSRRPLDEPDALPPEGTLDAAAFCLRAERLLEEDSRASLPAARQLLEDAARYFEREACVPAGLSRSLSALYLRHIVEDDSLIDAALEKARAAIALAPEAPAGHAALSVALMMDLHPVESRKEVEFALARAPDDASVLRAAAAVRLATGDLEAALEATMKAIHLRPDLPLHYYLLGNVKYMMGVESEAIVAYQNALALNPSHSPSLLQLAMAYDQSGDRRLSAALIKGLLEDDPGESSRAHVAMARSLMRRGGWEPALEILSRAQFKTRRGFGEGTLHHLRGLCHEELGHLEEARAAYTRVVEEFPEATPGPFSVERLADWGYEGLARVATLRRDPDGAAEALEKGSARDEAGPGLLIALARFYHTYNMPDRALKAYESAAGRLRVLTAAPILSTAFVEWARLAVSRADSAAVERLALSLETARPLLEAAKDDLIDLDAARALSIAGRGEEALRWLARAVSRGYRTFEWLSRDTDMESLRSAPGFVELSRRAEGPPPGRK